jgi:hypothetical protein
VNSSFFARFELQRINEPLNSYLLHFYSHAPSSPSAVTRSIKCSFTDRGSSRVTFSRHIVLIVG